jgi:signal transduction histidine kinase/CheY-like chemotaxis protein
MKAVQKHRLALVRHGKGWEALESSEARIVRDELKWGEEKLKTLFDSMSEGFAYHRIVLDGEGRPCDYIFLEVNEAFERLTGLKAGDILGKRATQILPGIEQDPTDWIGRYGRVALTGEPALFESYSAPLDKWYSVSAFSPHQGYFGVTFGDITERKQADEKIKKLNEELEGRLAELSAANASLRDSRRAALNLMEDSVLARRQAEEAIADLRREVGERKRAEEALLAGNQRLDLLAETANLLLMSDSPQSVVDVLCRKAMEVLDCHSFFNFLVNEERGCLHLNASAGIPEEEARRIEWLDYGVAVCGCAARDACRIVAEDIPNTPDPRTELVKSYGILAYACHPLMVQGQVLGTLSFGSRTQPRFSEEDLALMKAVADQVAIAMERKRTEEALRASKEAAEAATQAKSRFLANMSHELRTPMTGVLGMLELVLGGSLEPEPREFLGMAQQSAQSLLRILNDILDLTKMEAGKVSLEEEPFSLRECVAGSVDILLPEAKRKGIALQHSVADEVPEILLGDSVRLRQVLTNLVGNAVKFTERGSVDVRVTAGESVGGRCEVVWTVADTGIGIPAEKRHLLFQSFTQVDDSNTRRFGGTGLGLAISKEIVERMGGTINVESREGEGSTFSFTVPLGMADPKPKAAPSAAAKTPRAGDEGPEEAASRLLVAEDDPTIRKILGMMLGHSGYAFDLAEDGCQAVRMWEKGDYRLVFMDVQMPRLDGFEATRLIREKERQKGGHVPIIAMTAHALREDQERCLSAGMDAYISKPIDFGKCREMIDEILQGKAGGA